MRGAAPELSSDRAVILEHFNFQQIPFKARSRQFAYRPPGDCFLEAIFRYFLSACHQLGGMFLASNSKF
eukprot:4966493-Karenia_brevis.AAC.1